MVKIIPSEEGWKVNPSYIVFPLTDWNYWNWYKYSRCIQKSLTVSFGWNTGRIKLIQIFNSRKPNFCRKEL